MINSFRGKYFFLSNFFEVPVLYDGILYQSNEAAFQAQKTLDIEKRKKFANLNPSKAKALGRSRSLNLRKDWETVKIDIMKDICFAKFNQNPKLKKYLIETCNDKLEEGNDWGDDFWGTVNGKGENHLGIILMEIRSTFLKEAGLVSAITIE